MFKGVSSKSFLNLEIVANSNSCRNFSKKICCENYSRPEIRYLEKKYGAFYLMKYDRQEKIEQFFSYAIDFVNQLETKKKFSKNIQSLSKHLTVK